MFRFIGRSFLTSLLLILLTSLGCNRALANGDEDMDKTPVTTTVMVYMCGSDLESRFGAASRDISEMMSSGFDPAYTHVLIMAGGAKKWNTGFTADTTSIVEVGARGLRPVWRSDSLLSMADGTTLTTFLDFCYDRYPADRYGLIIWDHGGGPNEGACYDELFGWNTLSVRNLSYAIQSSAPHLQRHPGTGLSGTLNWIGFDACLMASMETAMTLISNAEYMIASQETEPSEGWNYAFLKGLEYDRDAEETGQRIVDGFFEGNQNTSDTLTLSCISLQKLHAVRNAMEIFYDRLYPSLTELSYPVISKDRIGATPFGRAEYNNSADYDLVDLISLIETNNSHGKEGERLIRTLRDAIAYSRSNCEGANGLSIYHPYFNAVSYEKKWADRYDENFTGMPPAYGLYIRRFGQILTGGELGDWSGLETQREVKDNGEISFSVQLTEEQAERMDHATLLVMKRVVASDKVLSSYYNVWETDYLQPDENRVLSAVFPGREVYVVDRESGEKLAGPVDYRITEDGRLQICVCFYDENEILDWDTLNTMYYCRFPETGNRLEIDSICAYNEVTHEYSNRMTVDEQLIQEMGYVYGMFYIQNRIPVSKGEELLGYRDWEVSGNDFVYDQISLSRDWVFEVQESEGGSDNTFVSFQITNSQNRTHSSTLCPIAPEKTREIPVEMETPENQTEEKSSEVLGLTAKEYLDSGLISLEIELDFSDTELNSYDATNIVVNGTTLLNKLSFSAYDRAPLIITLPKERLFDQDSVTELRFDLTKYYQDYSYNNLGTITITFPEPVLLQNAGLPEENYVPDEGGLIWKLHTIRPDENLGECGLLFSVTNPGKEPVSLSIKGIALENYLGPCYSWMEVPAGMTVNTTERLTLKRMSYDSRNEVQAVMEDVLGELGISAIDDVRIYYQLGSEPQEYCDAFKLAESVPYQPSEKKEKTFGLQLHEDGTISVSLELLKVYEDEETGLTNADLGIWLKNSGEERYITMDSYRVNGSRALNFHEDQYWDFLMPSESARFIFLKIETELPPEHLESVSLQFYVPELPEKTITIPVPLS